MTADLPIHAVLPDLLAALRTNNAAVLIAPPGAGKTTAIAPALLAEPWCTGQIVLLSPRRLAARAAAERMAELLGEAVGGVVGYRTRLDSRASAATRVLVVTEAIFVAMILADQELAGISAVLFDEAHERHLDSDLGLALALESQGVLRGDLRLLVMSATIAGQRFARLLGEGIPVLESQGRAFPLRIAWLGARPEQRIEDQVTSAVLHAWREEEGDILAFLPGVGEIEGVRRRLAERLPAALVLPLHGQVAPAEQRAAIRGDREGRRRIVLATSIAETSITLEGVAVVVDSGLSRRAQFDVAAGVTHLVTCRASRTAAAQRAGRAARTGPGVAYRLWEEAAHPGREAYDPPEMLTSDLAPLALALARWGVDDAAALPWLDPPPAPALAAARDRLRDMGALDAADRITGHGRRIAALPMAPWQAAMVLFGARHAAERRATRLALLLQERGLGGRGDDLADRLASWERDRSPRANASRKLADGWASRAKSLEFTRPELIEQPFSTLENQNEVLPSSPRAASTGPAIPLGILLAAALPDNLARRRDAAGERWLSATGRGYQLDPASPLARAEWLAIGDAQGSAREARITGALALESADVERWLGHRIERRATLRWTGTVVEARLERRLGAITLATVPDPAPDSTALARLLADKAVENLGEILPVALLARARHAGLTGLAPEHLGETVEHWLLPRLAGRRDLHLAPGVIVEALLDLLSWDDRQRLDRLAPREYRAPAGTAHPIDYMAEGGPAVDIRVQSLFGLDSHPVVGDAPLLIRLLSPAGRPLQATRDLPGFWRGSWAEVRREMKGRYPRHRWPEQPWTEQPSLKTRNAFDAASRAKS